jgi:hypothetical protein
MASALVAATANSKNSTSETAHRAVALRAPSLLAVAFVVVRRVKLGLKRFRATVQDSVSASVGPYPCQLP